ncbi:trypsin-like peptidase domain-containing protein [Bradyrhizobium sp. URHD0069]|uniref:trypsin-like peptidase domain-containing protein n=1 Tax=Bradyrhizobium sp. URHD0069 TaxID=1380355 RepID=UPI0004959B69|nr:trypsin-like peptidase domain-containing protein [Bradyrhizobium sp. URHD0069]
MPDIPKTFIDSTVTLLASSPVGTGFVMRIFDPGTRVDNRYLITCEHCVRPAVKARFCTGLTVDLANSDWTRSHTQDDVVAVDLTDRLLPAADFGYIDADLVLQRNAPHYGMGSDVYMLGTFVSEKDIGRNVPRARFGNVSALAEDDVPILQGNGILRPAHLADMRSRTGFSGSPVLCYLYMSGLSGSAIYREKLLGVHSAQYPERIKIAEPSSESVVEIPSSMTKIVPAWTIIELLDTPTFKADRDRRSAVAATKES